MKNQKSDWINQIRRERLQGSSRNPGTAALMSFFLMGMGQIYAGHIDRGIILLFMHLGGIFAAISIYTGGLVYNTVYPLIGAHFLIIICYVASVVFILLWIYNIKDAYYLALFSSFRDWFEVERVLVPMLQQSSGSLLNGPEKYQALPDSGCINDDEGLKTEVSKPEEEDFDVVELKIANVKQTSAEKKTRPKSEKEDKETVINPEGFATLRLAGSSWKIYVGLAAIFILLGLWINNNFVSRNEDSYDSMTHFVVSANMGSAPEGGDSPAALSDAVSGDVKSSPDSLPFMSGMQIMSTGNFLEAVNLFEKDFSFAEPSAEQWKTILSAYYRSDNKVAYETRLRQYLKVSNEDAQAWFNLGKLLYDRNEPAQAAQAIVNGLKYSPADLRGNYLLGSIYLDLKLFTDAVPYLQKIVDLEPLNPEFNRNLARALAATGQTDEAIRFFQRVLSLMPEDKEARMAVNSAKSGAMPIIVSEADENAVVVIQGKTDSRVIEKNREDDIPAAAVGKVLFEASPIDSQAAPPEVSPEIVIKEVAKDEQKKEKIKFASQKTEIEAVKKSTIKASEGISEIEAGIKSVTQVAAANKDDNESVDESFKNFVAQEQDKTAEDELNELTKKGSSEFSRGNWEGALESYLKILQKKKDAGVFETVSIIFEKLNSPKDAFSAVEHAYQLGKKDANTLTRLGRLASNVGDNAKGEFYLYHALQKMPHRIDLRILYAGCLHANGKSDIAEQELRRVIEASKDSYAVRRKAELELQKIGSGK